MHSENSKSRKLFGARDVLKASFEARKQRLGTPVHVSKLMTPKTTEIAIDVEG